MFFKAKVWFKNIVWSVIEHTCGSCNFFVHDFALQLCLGSEVFRVHAGL